MTITKAQYEALKKRLDKLEKYARLNNTWAKGVKTWAKVINKKTGTSNKSGKADQPPAAPKWPPK
jgi:hypothetical protein